MKDVTKKLIPGIDTFQNLDKEERNITMRNVGKKCSSLKIDIARAITIIKIVSLS